MKIAALCFCFIQVAAVNPRLFRREDYKNIDNNLLKDPTAKDTAELLMEGRQRTLFARRGVFRRQKLRVSKPIGGPVSPKVAPSPPKAVPPPPATPQCSRTMESCSPHSRCCDPCASCHCRFFNAICYCRKTGRHCQKAAWAGQ